MVCIKLIVLCPCILISPFPFSHQYLFRITITPILTPHSHSCHDTALPPPTFYSASAILTSTSPSFLLSLYHSFHPFSFFSVSPYCHLLRVLLLLLSLTNHLLFSSSILPHPCLSPVSALGYLSSSSPSFPSLLSLPSSYLLNNQACCNLFPPSSKAAWEHVISEVERWREGGKVEDERRGGR